MAPMEGAAWTGCALYLMWVRQTIVPGIAKLRHLVLILDLLPQMRGQAAEFAGSVAANGNRLRGFAVYSKALVSHFFVYTSGSRPDNGCSCGR